MVHLFRESIYKNKKKLPVSNGIINEGSYVQMQCFC